MSVYSDDDGAFKSKVRCVCYTSGKNITTLGHANVAERLRRAKHTHLVAVADLQPVNDITR